MKTDISTVVIVSCVVAIVSICLGAFIGYSIMKEPESVPKLAPIPEAFPFTATTSHEKVYVYNTYGELTQVLANEDGRVWSMLLYYPNDIVCLSTIDNFRLSSQYTLTNISLMQYRFVGFYPKQEVFELGELKLLEPTPENAIEFMVSYTGRFIDNGSSVEFITRDDMLSLYVRNNKLLSSFTDGLILVKIKGHASKDLTLRAEDHGWNVNQWWNETIAVYQLPEIVTTEKVYGDLRLPIYLDVEENKVYDVEVYLFYKGDPKIIYDYTKPLPLQDALYKVSFQLRGYSW